MPLAAVLPLQWAGQQRMQPGAEACAVRPGGQAGRQAAGDAAGPAERTATALPVAQAVTLPSRCTPPPFHACIARCEALLLLFLSPRVQWMKGSLNISDMSVLDFYRDPRARLLFKANACRMVNRWDSQAELHCELCQAVPHSLCATAPASPLLPPERQAGGACLAFSGNGRLPPHGMLQMQDHDLKKLPHLFALLPNRRVNVFTGVKYRDDPAIMAWELMNEPK